MDSDSYKLAVEEAVRILNRAYAIENKLGYKFFNDVQKAKRVLEDAIKKGKGND